MLPKQRVAGSSPVSRSISPHHRHGHQRAIRLGGLHGVDAGLTELDGLEHLLDEFFAPLPGDPRMIEERAYIA